MSTTPDRAMCFSRVCLVSVVCEVSDPPSCLIFPRARVRLFDCLPEVEMQQDVKSLTSLISLTGHEAEGSPDA